MSSWRSFDWKTSCLSMPSKILHWMPHNTFNYFSLFLNSLLTFEMESDACDLMMWCCWCLSLSPLLSTQHMPIYSVCVSWSVWQAARGLQQETGSCRKSFSTQSNINTCPITDHDAQTNGYFGLWFDFWFRLWRLSFLTRVPSAFALLLF